MLALARVSFNSCRTRLAEVTWAETVPFCEERAVEEKGCLTEDGTEEAHKTKTRVLCKECVERTWGIRLRETDPAKRDPPRLQRSPQFLVEKELVRPLQPASSEGVSTEDLLGFT